MGTALVVQAAGFVESRSRSDDLAGELTEIQLEQARNPRRPIRELLEAIEARERVACGRQEGVEALRGLSKGPSENIDFSAPAGLRAKAAMAL